MAKVFVAFLSFLAEGFSFLSLGGSFDAEAGIGGVGAPFFADFRFPPFRNLFRDMNDRIFFASSLWASSSSQLLFS